MKMYFAQRLWRIPVESTGRTNRIVYKGLLRFNDTKMVKWLKRKVIDSHQKQALSVPAYQKLHDGSTFPIIDKQNFHIGFPNYKDRIPVSSSDDFMVLKTSGSTSGFPSEIPISQRDIMDLRNYYQNLAIISNG